MNFKVFDTIITKGPEGNEVILVLSISSLTLVGRRVFKINPGGSYEMFEDEACREYLIESCQLFVKQINRETLPLTPIIDRVNDEA